MKRTAPLLITAIAGFVLIVAYFVPALQFLGERSTVWFDIMAAIAFILGGGNLLKIHLKKVSDRAEGWAYSIVTIIAFLAMLSVGLLKIGSRPAAKPESHGETFVAFELDDLPEDATFEIEGKIPLLNNGEKIPTSVRRGTLTQDGNNVVFRGWMLGNQESDLLKYDDTLEWRALVEELYEKAQPPDQLKGKIKYYADHRKLSFAGVMSDDDRKALLAMKQPGEGWQEAIEDLYARSRTKTSVAASGFPERLDVPKSAQETLTVDTSGSRLQIQGPMSSGLRDDLTGAYARYRESKPLDEKSRRQLREQIEAEGATLNSEQLDVFNKLFAGVWTVEQLRTALDAAGDPEEVDKTNREMFKEFKEQRQAGKIPIIEPKKMVGEKTRLNAAQVAAIRDYVGNPDATQADLVAAMKAAGDFPGRQESALRKFFAQNPTLAARNRQLYFAMLAKGPLSKGQEEVLLAGYRKQMEWRQSVDALYDRAHETKYAWSGDYSDQGNPFWWLYEYAFKPLTATMFAMLAFYVASAAFRAFRAKNLEATLLLGTAFIILLGRTFAGVLLTSWMPESLSGLRIENLTVYIMSVFNTAGSRAIMIGIALGIASTSLKVLLGVDRSYLGSGED